MASDPITVLHLSDIQFGRHHRFASDEGFDTLCQRLEDDLRGLAEEHDLHPDLVVVTGDLVEWGLAKESDEARRFLERLGSFLELPRQRDKRFPWTPRLGVECLFLSCGGSACLRGL